MTESSPALLELAGISKSFGGVQALREVDFTLRAGEIHGLVGENGAGKSTLMKIIAGVHSGYSGTMRIEGREVQFRSARDALAAGIGMVHQELSIAPDLTVAENVFPGHAATKGRAGRLEAHGTRVARAIWPPRVSTSTRACPSARSQSGFSS
jgi:ribose transport system ATP-binding protein